MNFNPGDNIYKFTLVKKLGGNFGDVWQAIDNTINREIALKILEPAYEPIAKLLDEARIGNKFNHKNLLPIHYADIVVHNGKTFTLISQEFYKNGAVTNHLNSLNFLPLPSTIKVLREILLGLEYLHNSGFYHNDIKPGNILMDDQMNAVLADYGIAGFSPNILPVTPKNSYIVHRAPETAISSPIISIHSDIYQVGCTAYRLLNGISSLKNEFHALGSLEYEARKAKGKIPDSSKYQAFVPSKLRMVINKSLAIDSNLRYASALEMRRKLERLSFPGHWTTDMNSNLIGIGQKYIYNFEAQAKPNGLFDFYSTKQSQLSRNTTKVSEFSSKNLNEKAKEKLKNDFIAWVVENAK